MSSLFYFILGILTMASARIWWPWVRGALISRLIASEKANKKKKKAKKPKKKKT